MVGWSAGLLNQSGSFNTILGNDAAASGNLGDGNTILGVHAGQFAEVGDSNVLIGINATNQLLGSHELVISNSEDEPLIFGQFNNKMVGINDVFLTHALQVKGDTNTIRLVGPKGLYGHGSQLNFGDGNFVYIEEIEDDKIKIFGNQGIVLDGGVGGVNIVDQSTKYKWVSPSEFKTEDTEDSYQARAHLVGVNDDITLGIKLIASIDLPQGAEVTEIEFHYTDRDTGDDINMTLSRFNPQGAGSIMASINSSGTTAGFSPETLTTSSITSPIIDNSNEHYYITISNDNATWPTPDIAGFLLTCWGVRISYQ